MQQRCLAAHTHRESRLDIQREQTYRCSRGVWQHTHTQKVDWTYRENRLTDAAEVFGSTHTHTQKVDWTYRENRLTDAAEVFGSTHRESRLDIQRADLQMQQRGVWQHTCPARQNLPGAPRFCSAEQMMKSPAHKNPQSSHPFYPDCLLLTYLSRSFPPSLSLMHTQTHKYTCCHSHIHFHANTHTH